jgi:hypothetical protein
MNQELKKKLLDAIDAIGHKAKNAHAALDAMQFSQAAVNLSNVIIGQENLDRK